MTILDGLRLFFGGLFALLLPGLVWSYVFFAKGKIDWIERLALSFGLSIALVPLSVFWLNWLFQMEVTLVNTSLIVCGLIIIAGVYILTRKYSWGKRAASKFKSVFMHAHQKKS